MTITFAKALESLRSGSEWVLRENDERTDFDLTWYDTEQTAPTKEEIRAEVARLTANQPRKEAEVNRSAAYRNESDPLFFKYQAGEVTKEEWLAKREEIKDRYPYPS